MARYRRSSPRPRRFAIVAASVVFVVVTGRAQSPIPSDFPRWQWEPTIAAPGARYAGDPACAPCHAAEAASQPRTLMAKALRLPADSDVLQQHPRLTFSKGRYKYEIRREGNGAVYAVSDGQRTLVVPILAAVGYGLGAVAQTYVFQYQGFFFESEVSYYDSIRGLDITPGHQNTTPAFLEGALGIRLPWRDQWLCFGCHSTAGAGENRLQLDQMMPGVSCEGCHGPGAHHIAAVKSGQAQDLHIFNPGSLPPGDLNDFCGSCHRTTLAEKLLAIRGVQNVRFQGYRLARSRCSATDDRRIACTACHNPHKPLVRDAAFYDSKCLACHASSRSGQTLKMGTAASACPVAKQKCVTCHMPKTEIPGIHFKFSDHWIRVAKAGAPYPE
ncbi:MAG TPA: multiheme c-type cytochrome [Terriglobia bacterium]|nr:multiheme c-type cytochrome [Terriglobia bacterium]